jgi:hypothetical protein
MIHTLMGKNQICRKEFFTKALARIAMANFEEVDEYTSLLKDQ